MRTIIFLCISAALSSGCGSNNASDEKCAAACKAPASGPCAGADEAACKANCAAMTSGLKTECVQCMIERSGWSGVACTCYGTPCTTCGFGGGGGNDSCHSPGQTEACTAAKESCTGFELYKATGSKCLALCGGVAADSGSTTKKSD